MAPKSVRKCSMCEQTFPKEKMHLIGGKNFCDKCALIRQKDIDDLKDLRDYIKLKLEPEDNLWPLITKQIKQYKEEYGFKYSGMKATLKYLFEYSEDPFNWDRDLGIAFLQYHYRKANQFFSKMYALKKVNPDEIREILEKKEKHVVINRSALIQRDIEFQKKKEERERTGLMTLDDVEDDELEVTDFSIKNRYSNLNYDKWDYDNLDYINDSDSHSDNNLSGLMDANNIQDDEGSEE